MLFNIVIKRIGAASDWYSTVCVHLVLLELLVSFLLVFDFVFKVWKK